MSHLCRLTFPSLILGCAVVSLGALSKKLQRLDYETFMR